MSAADPRTTAADPCFDILSVEMLSLSMYGRCNHHPFMVQCQGLFADWPWRVAMEHDMAPPADLIGHRLRVPVQALILRLPKKDLSSIRRPFEQGPPVSGHIRTSVG